MPRTKKQKNIKRRNWDDDEEIRRYDVVAKNTLMLYHQPSQIYGRVLLYGDVIIDLDGFTQRQDYIPKLQVGIMKVIKIVKLIKENAFVLYTESLINQMIDFESIIRLIKSISCQESYILSQRLEGFQKLTNEHMKLGIKEKQNNEIISLHYDPELLLKKCLNMVQQYLDYNEQLYAFNLYTFDPDKKRLNRYLSSNSIGLLYLISDDEEELKRCFLNMKMNQPQGDLNQFIKIQIPVMDQDVIEDIKIYTIDNYIIHGRIQQKCIKLSENSCNMLMIRKYTFQPGVLEELKRVRSIKKLQLSYIHSSLLFDSNINNNHGNGNGSNGNINTSNNNLLNNNNNNISQQQFSSLENMSGSDDSYQINTFLQKYEPAQYD